MAVYTLKEAIERAGTLDAEAVVAAMEKTDLMGVYGRIRFDPKNQSDHPQPGSQGRGRRHHLPMAERQTGGGFPDLHRHRADPAAALDEEIRTEYSSKFEARNPKQIQMTEISKFRT